MSDNAVEIVFRTKAELAGANAFRDSLERQIGAAKAAGKPFADLEQQLARVKISLAGADKPSFLDKLGPLAGGALGGMVAGLTSFAGALTTAKAALDKFAGAEQTVAKLDAALAQANLLSDSYREKLQGLAHGSEQWLAVLTRLTQFDAKPENIESYMQSVKDLAGIMGGDIEQAAHVFSLALQGNFEMLHRQGIYLDDTKTKVEQLADAQAQLAQRGRGQIEAANEGIAGGFRKVRKETGNLLEGFGLMISETKVVQTASFVAAGIFGFLANAIGRVVPKLESLQNKFAPAGMSALAAADQAKAFAAALKTTEKASGDAASGVDKYIASLKELQSLQDQREDAEMALQLGRVDESGVTGSKALEEKARIRQTFAQRKFERQQAGFQQEIAINDKAFGQAGDELRVADAEVRAQEARIAQQKRIEKAQATARDAANDLEKAAQHKAFAEREFREKPEAHLLAPFMVRDATERFETARRTANEAAARADRLGPGEGKSAADMQRELDQLLRPRREAAAQSFDTANARQEGNAMLRERSRFNAQTFGASSGAEIISQSVEISHARTEEANRRLQEALKAREAGFTNAFQQMTGTIKETHAAIQQVIKEQADLKETVKTLRQPP